MGKTNIARYFQASMEEKDESSIQESVIEYKVKTRIPKRYGRRAEDQKSDRTIKKVQVSNPNPQFKGKPKIPQEVIEKYQNGPALKLKDIKTSVHQLRFQKREEAVRKGIEAAALAEKLLTEDAGYLEADEGETTTQFTQKEILKHLDITAQTKHFDLQLQFGPYRATYTRNGRHLLLGGRKGHVAAFDWVTKRLACELNVMESVHDVCWLHTENMFAVAQKSWVYVYDNQGIELHCLKRLNKVNRMEFLPYHFLLASASDEGYLSWLDVSIGKLVSQFHSKLGGRLSLLAQNPWNATLAVGHAKGVVSMWSPNSRDPLAKMLCHKAPLTGLHIDPRGMYMATAACNRELKIWDVRNLEGPLQEYKLITAADQLHFSQTNMLAVGMRNVVEVYRDCCTTNATRPYLRHRFVRPISDLNFCPYEDVLGVGTEKGFTSLLVPGAGESNYDAVEANPYQTKSQRREAEVKALLDKIQPELISLNPTSVTEVDVPSLKDKIEAKQKLLFVKAPKIDLQRRKKSKGRGGTVQMAKNKMIVKEQAKREFVKSINRDTSERPAKTTKGFFDRLS